MPVLNIRTNLEKSKVPADFPQKISKVVAEALGKPESYVAVFVEADLLGCFAGSTEPCAFVELHSIGSLGSKVNAVSPKLTNLIHEELHIASNRFYISFVDVDGTRLTHNGRSFF